MLIWESSSIIEVGYDFRSRQRPLNCEEVLRRRQSPGRRDQVVNLLVVVDGVHAGEKTPSQSMHSPALMFCCLFLSVHHAIAAPSAWLGPEAPGISYPPGEPPHETGIR
jgi:hypothetical protein